MFDLKRFRKEQRLKQSDIANILGVTQVHISNIESGSRRLSDDQYAKLMSIYGADVIAQYTDNDDRRTTININKNSGNGSNLQIGDNENNNAMLDLIKEQSKQITKFQEQIDRLLSLLESKNQ